MHEHKGPSPSLGIMGQRFDKQTSKEFYGSNDSHHFIVHYYYEVQGVRGCVNVDTVRDDLLAFGFVFGTKIF